MPNPEQLVPVEVSSFALGSVRQLALEFWQFADKPYFGGAAGAGV